MIRYGKNHSTKQPGDGADYWMTQGPFGNTSKAPFTFSNAGFSVNGPHRNIGYIGKSYKMSKSGTPFKGNYAVGHGGSGGNYNTQNQVFNSNRFIQMGGESKYIKPSSLSTKGMLSKKYKTYMYNFRKQLFNMPRRVKKRYINKFMLWTYYTF